MGGLDSTILTIKKRTNLVWYYIPNIHVYLLIILKFAEYSLGGQSSTEGDVYSYGILLLELFTGRRPTDRQFIDDFNLHNFVKLSLPDQVMKIVDPSSFNENCAQNCQNWTVGWVEGLLTREQTDCLASLFYIGLACSEEHPGNRLNMMQVLEGLLSIREKFQQYA